MPKGKISRIVHLSLQSAVAVESGTKPKGYGYIKPDDNSGEPVYFEDKAVQLYSLDDLVLHQPVEYELDPKLPVAKSVTPVGEILSPPVPQVESP